MFEYNGHLFAAYSGAIAQRTTGGTLFSITGSLPGTDPVTFARNIKQPTSDLVVCRSSGGAYVLNVGGGSVAAYPDADLPVTVNSVDACRGSFSTPTRPTPKFTPQTSTRRTERAQLRDGRKPRRRPHSRHDLWRHVPGLRRSVD
jgi:hypothetical protein